MRRSAAVALSALLLLSVCSGCGSQGSEGGATSTGTARSVNAIVGPTYTQIKANVDKITGHDVDPNKPEVGPDGIVDKNMLAVFDNYRLTLIGTDASDWHGWYLYEGTESLPLSNPSYAKILMSPPQPGKDYSLDYDVTLDHLSSDQVSMMKNLRIGSPVTFSGTIQGVDPFALVALTDVTLQPDQRSTDGK